LEKFLNIQEKADRLQKSGLNLGGNALQIIKQRDEKGNFLGTRRWAIYGGPDELDEIFGQSTAYIERGHLTMRTFGSRLTRKGIAFSSER